jgi:hypothetical protein
MSASYRLRVRELEQERVANERLRLQTLIMAKAIDECGGTMSRKANNVARRVLGLRHRIPLAGVEVPR